MDHTLIELEDKGPNFFLWTALINKIEKAKEGKTEIEWVDLMNKKPNHPARLIVMTILEEPLDEKSIIMWFHKKIHPLKSLTLTLTLEMNDEQSKFAVWQCKFSIGTFNGQSHIQAKSDHQKKQCLKFYFLLEEEIKWNFQIMQTRMKIDWQIESSYHGSSTQEDIYETHGWVLSNSRRPNKGQNHDSWVDLGHWTQPTGPTLN